MSTRLDQGHIYLITNNNNGKCYVGQTWYDLNDRWSKHCSQNKRGCPYLHKAILKHGRSAFTIESLARFTDPAEGDRLESHYIELYQTIDPTRGYNLTYGGQGNRPPMPQALRNKISQSKTGIPFTEEHKANLTRGIRTALDNLSTESQQKLDASRARKRKLTMEQANQLREDRKNGLLLKELVVKYQINMLSVWQIVHNKTYINDYQE